MAENRFAKYAGQGGAMIPGTGPKPPSGFGPLGAAPIAPLRGGPNDPQQAAAVAAAEARARAAASTPIEVAGQIAAARAKGKIDLANEQAKAKLAPKLTPEVRAQAIAAFKAAQRLEANLADLKAKYRAGPGATKGIRGLMDFLPTPENAAFDKAANGMRGDVGAALGFTGGQLNSIPEIKMNLEPYVPSSWNYDNTSEDSFARTQRLAKNARERAIAQLGGIPDQNGNITPLPKQPRSKPQPPASKSQPRVIDFNDLPE